MRMSTNKTKATTALVLVLTIVAAFMAFLPVANAVVEEQTHFMMAIEPNPVGVGQTVTINVWIEPIPPTSSDRYTDEKVVVTFPDGVTTETFGPASGGPLGNVVWQFVPSVTGTYKFQGSMPDQNFPDLDLIRLGSTSPIVELLVQQDPVEPLPDNPLPTEYWTYPISAENRLWAGTSGAWLIGSNRYPAYNGTNQNFNPYTTAPKTAHILWTRQQAFGGIEGGEFGAVAYAEGHMYEGKGPGPGIIINRYLYTYSPAGDRQTYPEQTPLSCIDLATGETVWEKDLTVDFGQIYEYNSVNQVGLHAYLWDIDGSTWHMYDAYTGNWIMDFVNATRGGYMVFDPIGSCGGSTGKGAILRYYINTEEGWMAMWNFTKACDGDTRRDGVITYQSDQIKEELGVYGGQWRPRSTALNDWRRGIEWNVSIPQETVRLTSFSAITAPFGYAIATTGFSVTGTNDLTMIWCYSLDPNNPRKMWGPVNFTASSTSASQAGSGVYVRFSPNEQKLSAWNLVTGAVKWTSDPTGYPWGAYGDTTPQFAYDRVYFAAYDGMHCFNAATGKEEWNFYPGDSGYETPYGTWVPRFHTSVIADGKVFFTTGVWKPEPVMQRGDRLFCLDAFTGKNIWNITCFGAPGALANGYLVWYNGYQNQILCFNKGPSKTTVSASPKVVANGDAVLIEGTVTDQSPASKDTPAIADKFMTEWMEYLHMQHARPMDAFGVPVVLQAMRSDRSIIDIATIYSDINGHFEYMWTPPTQDTYKILATFPGSDAYWMSWAETALGVGAAQSEAESETATDYTPMFAGIIAAVAVAIIIGIVNLWALRKK